MKYPAIIFSIILAFIACQEVQDARVQNEFLHPDSIVNPNGDSELALVMREIHFEANIVGRALESGQDVDLSKLKDLSKRMSTSVPTDSNVLDEVYYSFTTTLESHVKQIEEDSAIVEFNSVVETCVACHKNTCPGPIEKIQKLKIKS